ncbi:haloacid dehalogenase-like hydrolase [Kitasatospora sp. NBC_01287]|uniref:HAD family hydrolase n=1 Tax=Kitasatospora sp. NBC_01287 TaxID=2903573 RepID=UPI00224E8DDC|nr:haloacid dehalogenase-like hydrolase [Kitasatospora sp. NBC_01287]MCX4751204.1 haloacid dehalogenase-like hydrolase [Kitasatospora sp. NBC_01287]
MALIVLWDIDHTLIDNAGVSKEIYGAAFAAVARRQPSGPAVTDGRTDRLIMREMFDRDGLVQPDWDIVQAALEAAGRERSEELRQRGRALPGARDVLTAVGKEPGIISSVLTGNIAANARLKLAAFGLDGLVDLEVGAYGADRLERAALVHVACDRIRAAYTVPGRTVVTLVGDTPRDVEAALTNGVEIVAVATGVNSAAELRRAGASAVLPDLTDTAALMSHFKYLAAEGG